MNKKNNDFFRVNNKIRSKEVRIVGDGVDSRIVNIDDALSIAHDMDMDLVEIVPHANPPVCKIMDFQKFIYERKQKDKELKKLQRKNTVKVKEIRLTYNTGEHDFNFKLNHAKNFLTKGNRVKAYVFFSGRELQFVEQGKLLLLKFVDDLSDYGKIEQMPKLENRRLWVMILPKKQTLDNGNRKSK